MKPVGHKYPESGKDPMGDVKGPLWDKVKPYPGGIKKPGGPQAPTEDRW